MRATCVRVRVQGRGDWFTGGKPDKRHRIMVQPPVLRMQWDCFERGRAIPALYEPVHTAVTLACF